MLLEALIFDVDGTLADTEEAHRCTFNDAFHQHGPDWRWSRREYAQLLRTTGGKERIGVYLDSLDLPLEVRQTLRARIGAIHATKTDLYTRNVGAGAVPLREGVVPLIEEARRARVFSEDPRTAMTGRTEVKHAMIGEMACSVTSCP